MRLRRRGSVLRRRRGEAALEGDESGSALTGLQLRRRGAAAVEEIAVRVKKKRKGSDDRSVERKESRSEPLDAAIVWLKFRGSAWVTIQDANDAAWGKEEWVWGGDRFERGAIA